MKLSNLLFLCLGLASCNISPRENKTTVEGKHDSLMIEQDNQIINSGYINEEAVQHDSIISQDSIHIYFDIYERKDLLPSILLCHQAGYSRGEYVEIALELAELGFSSVAMDQRSGEGVNGIENKTFKAASATGKSTDFISAIPDISIGIDYVFARNNNEPIILWGSSYSASLVLLASKNPKVKAVISFSPGEYFEGISIKDSLSAVNIPIYVTSSKLEAPQTKELTGLIDSILVHQFIPIGEGKHGSKALWSSSPEYADYWRSLKDFLLNLDQKTK